jgi:hypothetical protein
MPTEQPVAQSVKGECGCGCGRFGTLRKRPEGHVRGCTCPRCTGQRNRRSGLDKQRRARTHLGVAPSHRFGDANEERWNDPLFANEVKSGAQCGPVANAWRRAEAQVIANRPDHGGAHKPTRVTWMPDGWGDRGLVTVTLATWDELVRPALEALYG